MSKESTNSDNQNSNRPTHNVYSVRDIGREKPFWGKVGVAWTHKDSKGFTQKLDILGLEVELVVRQNKPIPTAKAAKKKATSKGPRP